MSDHAPRIIERHCDVAVIGGSAAGLAAAIQLGRQRRSVIVIDAGDPRNAPATHMHSYLGYDGVPPTELVATGRDEVRRYGGEVLAGRVVGVAQTTAGEFRVDLVGGHAIVARRVLVATGIIDELPGIDGLAGLWGSDVIHCPFCHGFEVRDQRIVQIVTDPINLHPTPLLRQLTSRLTVVVHGEPDVDRDRLDVLRAGGIEVVEVDVTRVVTDWEGHLAGLELADGRWIDADAILIGPRFRPRIEPLSDLDLAITPHPSGLGDVVVVDDLGATNVPGVYAAGNVTDPGHQVLQAAAHGSRVGAMISFSLAEQDLQAAARPSATQPDWDHRYSGGQMWSGNPNGSFVHEVAGLTPGRALDVGAGEGGDAIWLAEQGWAVTANEVSERALERIATEAERRGLNVECLHADANDREPFPVGAFDLVAAQYASIPRTPDGRAVHNVLAAVAPGGTLVVIGHDLTPMRTPIDTATHSRAFDPDAYVGVDDFAAAVQTSSEWTIEVNELRPRPPGAASSHHVDDVVLRARRR